MALLAFLEFLVPHRVRPNLQKLFLFEKIIWFKIVPSRSCNTHNETFGKDENFRTLTETSGSCCVPCWNTELRSTSDVFWHKSFLQSSTGSYEEGTIHISIYFHHLTVPLLVDHLPFKLLSLYSFAMQKRRKRISAGNGSLLIQPNLKFISCFIFLPYGKDAKTISWADGNSKIKP